MLQKRVINVFLLSFFLISLAILALASAENLNLKVTGTVNGYNSDVRLKTNSNAEAGFDAYDMPTPSSPDNLSQFYSSAGSQSLAIDSWEFNTSRTVNLVYSMPEAQTGNLVLSWEAITGNYTANLIYYGDDSSYTNNVSVVNMRDSSSFTASLDQNTTDYLQISVSNYSATVSPSCGDGTCNGVETCSSCAADCGVCPVVTPSSGGGGGGGTAVVKNIEIDVSDVNLDLVLNQSKDSVVKITNKGKNQETISIKQQNLGKLIAFEETSFTLAPGESRDIRIVFTGSVEPGIYTGKITLGGKEISVSINLKSKELLFDSLITVPESNKMISPGKNLNAQITLIPMGDKEQRADVTVNYVIKDFDGNVYLTESETVLVEQQKSYSKQFFTSDLPVGKYIAGIEAVYSNGIATSSVHFEVVENSLFKNLPSLSIVFYLVILVLVILVVYVIVSRIKYSHKKAKRK